jgi:molybdopterin synthase sulfur carrier subunit
MSVARVVLSSGFSRRYTDGKREFDIEATTMRDVIRALDKLYPGLGEHLEEETTVAIDGEIHDQPT